MLRIGKQKLVGIDYAEKTFRTRTEAIQKLSKLRLGNPSVRQGNFRRHPSRGDVARMLII